MESNKNLFEKLPQWICIAWVNINGEVVIDYHNKNFNKAIIKE